MGTPRVVPAKVAGQIFHMKFDGNYKDSDMWNLHGIRRFKSSGFGSGQYAKIGTYSAYFDDSTVEVGTEDCTWSTCAGGNCCGGANKGGGPSGGNMWVLSEAKFNFSAEMWVYPTSLESEKKYNSVLLTKHTFWTGGYSMRLLLKGGTYRLAFQSNFAYGGPDTVTPGAQWDWTAGSCNGLRGAYSNDTTGVVPVNQWTHVAVTFDYLQDSDNDGQPDNADWTGFNGTKGSATNYDPSFGKIRLYVNGEDVTWSDVPGYSCWTQPHSAADTWATDLGYGFQYQEWMTPQSEGGMKYGGMRCGWCGNSLSIGGYMWSSIVNFKGYIDEVKVWNVTKEPNYFSSAIPPAITKVQGQTGYDKLHVQFSEGVYNGSGGALGNGDLTLNSDGRTYTISHTAGDDYAILTLSTPLDTTTDINVDTVAPGTNKIYDSYATIPSEPDSVVITRLSAPEITKVEGAASKNELWVTFSAGVYGDEGLSGSLVKTDFNLVLSDNSRTISSVVHGAGSLSATLYLDSNLDANDLDAIAGDDTLAAVPFAIFGGQINPVTGNPGSPVRTEAVDALPQPAPTIVSVTGAENYDQLTITFSEGVYTTSGTPPSGDLTDTDFTFTEVGSPDDGRTILSVTHTAGASVAGMTLSAPFDSTTDIDSDTLNAKTDEVVNINNTAMSTTPVVITELTTPVISKAEGYVGSDLVKITFVAPVYANDDQTGALVAADFLYTDTVAGWGAGSITTLSHNSGDGFAYATMDITIANADLDVVSGDTVAAMGGSIFFADGTVGGTVPKMLTTQLQPYILNTAAAMTGYNIIEIEFSEGVWGSGTGGKLDPADIIYQDRNDNSNPTGTTGPDDGGGTAGAGITSVAHTPGEATAALTMASDLLYDDMQYPTFPVNRGLNSSMDFVTAASSAVTNIMGNPALSGFSAGEYTSIYRMKSQYLFDVNTFIGDNHIQVLMSGPGSGSAAGGQITTSDLTLSGMSGQAMTSVEHVDGETAFSIVLDGPVVLADIGVATLAAKSASAGSIWDLLTGYPMGIESYMIKAEPTPQLVQVDGSIGYDMITAHFDQEVFADTGADPNSNLQIGDFTLYDGFSGNGIATIVTVIHSPGIEFYRTLHDLVYIKLSKGLDASEVGTTGFTLAPTTVYNDVDNPAPVVAVQITDMPQTVITSVIGSVGSDKLDVSFKHFVATNPGMQGALTGLDFTLIDSNSDNARTITEVDHRPGDLTATLTMSAPLIFADVNVDTLGAALVEIFNSADSPVDDSPVPITVLNLGPRIMLAEGRNNNTRIYVTFDQPVYANADGTGDLTVADFAYDEISYALSGSTITSVTHTAGDDWAMLLFTSQRCNADKTRTINAATQANPVNITTTTNHGMVDNDVVYLYNIGGMTEIDGNSYTIDKINNKNFTLHNGTIPDGVDGTGYTAFVNDGDARVDLTSRLCPYAVTETNSDFWNDFIRPAADSVFSESGIAAVSDTTNRALLMTMNRPRVMSAKGVLGSKWVLITFEEPAWSKKDMVDAVGTDPTGDFNYISNNGRTIENVIHNPGDKYALLELSAVTIGSDFGEDTFQPRTTTSNGNGSIWNSINYAFWQGWQAILREAKQPYIISARGVAGSDQVAVTFSEGVRGIAGDLIAGDFAFVDNGTVHWSISSVSQHTVGDSVAYLTMTEDAGGTGDFGVDTFAATSDLKSAYLYDPLKTDPVTLSGTAITLLSAEGSTSNKQVLVTFSAPVYSASNRTGALAASDFDFTDVDDGVGSTDDVNPRTITSVTHTAGEATAVLTFTGGATPFGAMKPLDVNDDTLAPASGAIFDDLGQALSTVAVTISSMEGPWITRVEGAVGQDTLQVNFSVGVYSETISQAGGAGYRGGVNVDDFVWTDDDDGRTITAVEHYKGSGAAILTLSSVLDSDSDIGVDMLAAMPNEIFSKSEAAMRTTPVTVIGNDCPPWGAMFEFNEADGSTATFDNTGLIEGLVYSADPAFGITGDGYFTGDPAQQIQTYMEFTKNRRCFKTPRAYTIETRVFFDQVDISYGDAYPLNDQDDDYDAGDPDGIGGLNMLNALLSENDPTTPDGRKYTKQGLFFRDNLTIQYQLSKTNYGDQYTLEGAFKGYAALRHKTQTQRYCDTTHPGIPDPFKPTLSQEWGAGPFIAGHWYVIRFVFNTDKDYLPFDFFARDEGTDGEGMDAEWDGYISFTNEPDLTGNNFDCGYRPLPGLELDTSDQAFAIGDDLVHDNYYDPLDTNIANNLANGYLFAPDSPGADYTSWLMGKMDWLIFRPIADYSNMDDGPWTMNTVPVADAGADANAPLGLVYGLDGTGSSDADGDTLQYSWTIISQPGSAILIDSDTEYPTFVPDVEGDYVIELLVDDGNGGTDTDTVTITVETAPVADAGPDQQKDINDFVTLDGSGSSDDDGTPTYSWAFTSKPAASTATLANPTTVSPTFTVDVQGSYIIELTVSDGVISDTDSVTVQTGNPPDADAGNDQNVSADAATTVTLDGSASSDPDGDPLKYTWTLEVLPSCSAAAISTDVMSITAATQASPVNITAASHGFTTGDPVYITGVAGMTEINDRSFIITVTGANNFLLDNEDGTDGRPAGTGGTAEYSVTPTFTADMNGTYAVQLIVNDGAFDSTASAVFITADYFPNSKPGADQTVTVSNLVSFDGSSSDDDDGDAITAYSWSITSQPAGLIATITGATQTNPVVITTSSSHGYSTGDLVDITGIVGMDELQDMSYSITVIDANNFTLDGEDGTGYFAYVSGGTAEKKAELSSPTTATPSFTPEVAGVYVIELQVYDAYTCTPEGTAVDTLTVTVNP